MSQTNDINSQLLHIVYSSPPGKALEQKFSFFFWAREHKLIVRNRHRVFFCAASEKHERRLVNMQMFCSRLASHCPLQVCRGALRKTNGQRKCTKIWKCFLSFSTVIVPLQADEYKCVFLEALPVQISMNAEYNAKTR